jgi:hypothetical protein
MVLVFFCGLQLFLGTGQSKVSYIIAAVQSGKLLLSAV